MKIEVIKSLATNFESFVNKTNSGVEFWLARDLQKLLGYDKWENFLKVIEKAKIACKSTGNEPDDHFPDVRKMILYRQTRIFAGDFTFFDNFLKIFPLIISKQLLQVARKPKFQTVFGFLRVVVKIFV